MRRRGQSGTDPEHSRSRAGKVGVLGGAAQLERVVCDSGAVPAATLPLS